jgi:metal-responsive CopG/Arc/MetJ family transcriptional regulator
MKTAISIPDHVFRAAERLAKQMRVSRSRLYAQALERYLTDHDREHLTEQLNDACEKVDTSLDPALRRAQARTLRPDRRETW